MAKARCEEIVIDHYLQSHINNEFKNDLLWLINERRNDGIFWNKQHFVISRGDYHNKHEPLWYGVRKGKNHNWQGKRDQSTVWEIENNNSFGSSNKEETWGHGTQKPLECMLRPILNNSAQGQSVYDPFGGSGTTLIACERSRRDCYMMELSPAYVDVIIKRWEKETNKKAVLLNG